MTCPGEAGCREGEAGNYSFLFPGRGSEDPEVECPQCPLRPTKPGTEPPGVAWALSVANAWDRKKEMGFVITDLNTLTPMEWAAREGLESGRTKWRNVVNKRNLEAAERNRNK
jgi:hypothetical protein